MRVELKDFIRDVPDFPKPGIVFRDIAPLLADPEAFGVVIEELEGRLRELRADVVVAIESRGFIFAAPLAVRARRSMVLVRKLGKLPGKTERQEYGLEYGAGTLEIQQGALAPGARVVIVDDVLATGGTAAAAAELVSKVGGVVVGYLFLAELRDLGGREALGGTPVSALVEF